MAGVEADLSTLLAVPIPLSSGTLTVRQRWRMPGFKTACELAWHTLNRGHTRLNVELELCVLMVLLVLPPYFLPHSCHNQEQRVVARLLLGLLLLLLAVFPITTLRWGALSIHRSVVAVSSQPSVLWTVSADLENLSFSLAYGVEVSRTQISILSRNTGVLRLWSVGSWNRLWSNQVTRVVNSHHLCLSSLYWYCFGFILLFDTG
jgi:hypothetical protein